MFILERHLRKEIVTVIRALMTKPRKAKKYNTLQGYALLFYTVFDPLDCYLKSGGLTQLYADIHPSLYCALFLLARQ